MDISLNTLYLPLYLILNFLWYLILNYSKMHGLILQVVLIIAHHYIAVVLTHIGAKDNDKKYEQDWYNHAKNCVNAL